MQLQLLDDMLVLFNWTKRPRNMRMEQMSIFRQISLIWYVTCP